jgi:hypothetical protein
MWIRMGALVIRTTPGFEGFIDFTHYRRTTHWFLGAHWRAFGWKYGGSFMGNIKKIWAGNASKISLSFRHVNDWSNDQVFAFMLDNASNNDTMIEGIQKRAASEGIKIDAAWARLRCMPHTIHLAAIKVN